MVVHGFVGFCLLNQLTAHSMGMPSSDSALVPKFSKLIAAVANLKGNGSTTADSLQASLISGRSHVKMHKWALSHKCAVYWSGNRLTCRTQRYAYVVS